MVKSLQNTKSSNATNAHRSQNLTHLATKKAMTSMRKSFGFVVVVGENKADNK
jgi:hypothetical protein